MVVIVNVNQPELTLVRVLTDRNSKTCKTTLGEEFSKSEGWRIQSIPA